MPNAWDGTSALLLKQAGFKALGTSSAAIAAAMGRLDGRHAVSREEHIANAQLLGNLTDLPINGDFEDGYGASAADVALTVEAAIAAGLAGIGIEDTTADPANPIARSTTPSTACVRRPRSPKVESSSPGAPTTSFKAGRISTTRSSASSHSPRSVPTSSMRHIRPTWTRSGQL